MGIVTSGDEITLLSELGVTILLFVVGLKLDIKLVKRLGTDSAILGVGQIVLTAALGTGLCLLMGFDLRTAFLIGVALSFSSTIIIVKILSDKREIDALHGRLALGVLIIQDFAVVLSMIVLATMGAQADGSASAGLAVAVLQMIFYVSLLLIVLGLFMRFAALRVVTFLAHHTELLVLFSIALAILLAALCNVLGLSKELGGLLAGISLASTPYREAIIARLSSLRDFLLLFFFIALGLQLEPSMMGGMAVPALILSIFVLFFKPFVIMALAGLMGYRKRVGFLAGVSLAQISEFSLIFVALTYGLGLIEQEILGLVTMVGLITITLSTYLLSLSHQLYVLLEPYVGVFERAHVKKGHEYDMITPHKIYDIIIFGLGRYGQAMAEGFINAGKNVLVVDFNPEEIKRWQKKGGDALYGDACDPEFFHTLPLAKVKWVISALPQHNAGLIHEDPRLVILSALKASHYTGKAAVACHHIESTDKFRALGADIIFLPFHDAANRAVNMVLKASGEPMR